MRVVLDSGSEWWDVCVCVRTAPSTTGVRSFLPFWSLALVLWCVEVVCVAAECALRSCCNLVAAAAAHRETRRVTMTLLGERAVHRRR